MDFRTDMAVERTDIYRKAKKLDEIPGIECVAEEIFPKIKVLWDIFIRYPYTRFVHNIIP